MAVARDLRRSHLLSRIVLFLAVVLFAKVLASILYEYRWYFPANFLESSFLLGRQDYFHGTYGIAFYVHIISGPIAVVLGAFLISSGARLKFCRLHRFVGKIQLPIVVLLVVPSGAVMATKALTGPVAGTGFMVLAGLTATSILAAVYFAMTGRIEKHRLWAIRCFLLLCSPFLLRLMNGAAFVTGIESATFYQMAAWFSWILPLIAFEIFRQKKIESLINHSLFSTKGAVE